MIVNDTLIGGKHSTTEARYVPKHEVVEKRTTISYDVPPMEFASNRMEQLKSDKERAERNLRALNSAAKAKVEELLAEIKAKDERIAKLEKALADELVGRQSR